MEISNYEPPPRSPTPPPPPPRKYRSAIVMATLFVGAFCVTFAALNRHELAAILSRHDAKPSVTAVRPSATAQAPQTAHADSAPPAPAQSQAAVMPPSVFQ